MRRNYPGSGAGSTPLYGCGVGVFSRIEVQPGALSILFRQAPALEAATDALADHLNQGLQFAFVRCLDALKLGWSLVAPIFCDSIFWIGAAILVGGV